MALTLITTVSQYIGLSGDTKPASPPAGSTFFETDTGARYIFDGTNWVNVGAPDFSDGEANYITCKNICTCKCVDSCKSLICC